MVVVVRSRVLVEGLDGGLVCEGAGCEGVRVVILDENVRFVVLVSVDEAGGCCACRCGDGVGGEHPTSKIKRWVAFGLACILWRVFQMVGFESGVSKEQRSALLTGNQC